MCLPGMLLNLMERMQGAKNAVFPFTATLKLHSKNESKASMTDVLHVV